MRLSLSKAAAIWFGLAAFAYAQSAVPPVDEQSRSGPLPPPGAGPKIDLPGGPQSAHVISGVPGYLWRHGCGPTSVGMVVGYYDTHGYGHLIPGDASTQTDDVNQAIASQGSGVRGGGTQRHYEDYALPMDSGQPVVIPDSSQTYPNGCHADECIADYMHTSWSKDGNFYGWGYGSRVGTGFNSYVNLRNSGYSPTSSSQSYSPTGSALWSLLQTEVNNNRPMVFLVDSDGDGSTDHFVTIVGYDDGTPQQYGCLDTWDPPSVIRWCQYRSMSSSYAWGVSTGYTFRLRGPADPVNGSPANGAGRQAMDVTLSWTAGAATSSFDVYFGATPTPGGSEFQGNQTATTFTTGLLAANTTYYWRIDAKNSYGTSPGDVWSFTTAFAADFDRDGDVDQADLTLFRGCMTGTGNGPPASGCGQMDIDRDGDVDQSDFGMLQRCLAGGGAVIDPSCLL
jgi:hypothetical protein